MSKLTDVFVKLDKVLMVLFAVAAVVIGVIFFQTNGPEWKKKYQKAAAEAQKTGYGETENQDPEGYVLVGAIQNGKFTYVRMKRKDRDRLARQQSGR